ncbi:MAG: DNA mismatch repair endonuclease MutL, partial [Candidatus Margulisiibacteriota bacterium]
MQNRIIVLNDNLVSKIAAGEVVERPASVVKELAENSIDAGAKRIEIEVHNGGKSLIRVTDDGSGMNQEEAKLSLERHATSKIKNIDDLFNIHTLGFRGEALPSIASISRLELIANDGVKGQGSRVKVEGGKAVDGKDFGCPKGTSIIVKDLFFNTPARLKYLKSDATESSHIINVVSKFILSRPDIAFKLTSNGKSIFSSQGSGKLDEAIAEVWGEAVLRDLVALEGNCVKGYISKPAAVKINREYQVFFVNKRHVQNFQLSRALEAAYHTLIPKDKHPLAVLFLETDPADIDVNVHPSKKEIKFSKPKQVFLEISEAARHALIDTAPIELISSPSFNINSEKQKWTPEMRQIWMGADPVQTHCNASVHSSQSIPISSSPRPIPLFQLDQTYIICADGPDLVIVDQHAAHERILYEKLKNRESGIRSSQYSLIPEIIEIPAKDFANIKNAMGMMAELGFDIEEFGKNSIRIKAVPGETTKVNLKRLVNDILDEFSSSS